MIVWMFIFAIVALVCGFNGIYISSEGTSGIHQIYGAIYGIMTILSVVGLAICHGFHNLIKKQSESKSKSNVPSDTKTSDKMSAINRRLINAAGFGLCEEVKKLLERGADPNAKDEKRKSALDYAKEKEHSEVVQILKESGAKE